jgi:hypothetical protein
MCHDEGVNRIFNIRSEPIFAAILIGDLSERHGIDAAG